jgi:hypothetical protein
MSGYAVVCGVIKRRYQACLKRKYIIEEKDVMNQQNEWNVNFRELAGRTQKIGHCRG